MTDEPKKTSKWRLRKALRVIGVTLAYMLPLLWLWAKVDFPDSVGLDITAHGEGGLIESWWYSYLLLERHTMLDIVTFAYMWAGVVAIIAWIVLPIWRSRKAN
ncbi:MAG: hypothetical protein ABIT09_05085 [Croceibacterium sp.]